jgi:type I restriction enzyme S subunit
VERCDDLRDYLLQEGDVVLAMDRPWIPAGLKFAKVRAGDQPALLVQRVARLRPKPGLTANFLHYVIASPDFTQYIQNVTTGTAVPHISASQIREYKFKLPDLLTQATCGELLMALDDRIALLRETNATLEAIAQALFKSWFVDFDPVRAKQQGQAPAGMDEATAALFPDSFEESALGLVPKGWNVRALDEIAAYLNGLALQKFPPSDDSWLPVIKIAQLRKGDTVGADRAGRNLKPEYIVQNGDVLFSWSGSLEVEVWCGGEGALNQHLFKVTSKDFPKWFYLHWTRHHLDHFRQIAASKATTMGHIQRAHLAEAKVLVPPAPLIGAMDTYFAPLLARIVQNEQQAQTLATLRDTLLPRLISGQLRLPDAEALAASA